MLRGVVRVAAQHNLFAQALAVQLGIGPTDLDCLFLLDDFGPATAGQLAEVLGLTTGAITGVVDRLVGAGFVLRDSDPADRRRVIIRSVPERAQSLDDALGPVAAALAEATRAYTRSERDLVLDFERRVQDVLARETARLKATHSGAPASLSAPLGELARAALEFTDGAADVRILAGEEPSELYRASFDGVQPTLRLQSGTLSVRYRRMGPFEWGGARPSGSLGLNPTLPWTVNLRGGAAGVSLDARGLELAGLCVEGGANKLDVWLPSPRGSIALCLGGGANRVLLQRPQGVPMQLQVRGGANRLEFDGQRFGAVGGDLRLASPGWELAEDRYSVEILGGASRLTIQEQ
jgi:DNA-binding MarR family transcriptional regulator